MTKCSQKGVKIVYFFGIYIHQPDSVLALYLALYLVDVAVAIRGAPSPGKVCSLDSPPAWGLAERHTRGKKQEPVGVLCFLC